VKGIRECLVASVRYTICNTDSKPENPGKGDPYFPSIFRGSLVFGMKEKFFRPAMLDQFAEQHEYTFVRSAPCLRHVMSDDHDRILTRKAPH
jgi:hypothetical protein